MGKRELMLIVGFVVLGALVYQVSAPARAPASSTWSFGGIIDDIRARDSRQPGRAEVTSKHTHAVTGGDDRAPRHPPGSRITIVGENRTDIESELWVRSNGGDDAEAKKPGEGDQAGRGGGRPMHGGRVRLPRSPAPRCPSCACACHRTGGPARTSGGQSRDQRRRRVELENARGEAIVHNITGRVT